MDVIRFVLSEDDVRAVGQDIMCSLANCSTSSVMLEVRRYLSNPKAAKDVVDIVKIAFAEELGEIASEADSELLGAIEAITGLRFNDICSTVSLQDLQHWKDSLQIMRQKGDFRPYKSAIRLFNVKEIVDALKESGHADIAKKIYVKRNVFSEINTARAVGTPFKRAYFQSTQIEIKERGIDFLIRMKQAGTPAMSWRFL